jgi:hypothetical protein
MFDRRTDCKGFINRAKQCFSFSNWFDCFQLVWLLRTNAQLKIFFCHAHKWACRYFMHPSEKNKVVSNFSFILRLIILKLSSRVSYFLFLWIIVCKYFICISMKWIHLLFWLYITSNSIQFFSFLNNIFVNGKMWFSDVLPTFDMNFLVSN